MNRRRHPRLDIDIPAVVEYQGQAYAACRLLNFSRGGAYLQCADADLKALLPDGYFAEYERPEAQLSIPSESLQVKVSVVYFHDEGLGLAFRDIGANRLFDILAARQQSLADRQPQAAAVETLDPARAHQLIDQIRHHSQGFLNSNLSYFFGKTLLELQQLIDETGDPQEKSVLFYAFNSMEQDQAELIRRFLEMNAQSFAALLGESREIEEKEVEEPAELALVEKREIDIWILVNDAARHAEADLSTPLFQLEIALSYLCQGNIHNELNPLAPISLLTQLKTLLDDFELDVRTAQLVIGVFRNTLLSDLSYLYAELLQLLREHGIGGEDRQLQGQWTIVKTAEQRAQGGTSIGHLAALVNRRAGGGGEGTLAGISESERDELLTTLASLSSLQGVSLQQQVERLMAQEVAHPVKLSPEVRSAIGAGEELVAVLSKDPLITPELRALLDSLKFLIIEAVLQNTDLLDNPEHPVQRVLAAIEALRPYVNTGPQGSLMRDRETQRLAVITEGVENGRLDHVNQVAREIEALLSEHRERFEKNRKLAISRCLKDEKLRKARATTHEALSNLLLRQSVSIAVDTLLRFGWVNLMVQTLVAEGGQNKGWRGYLEIIEQLLVLFAPQTLWHPPAQERQQVLLATLHKGFSEYPVHPAGARQYEESLRKALAGNERTLSVFIEQRIEVDEAYLSQFFQGMQLARELHSPAVDPAWEKTVQELALDTWLIEQTDRGEMQVLSLAWKNPFSQRYLLVNGNGFTALDENLPHLAARFAALRLTPMELPTQPIVERTIETILSNSYDGYRQESSLDPLTGLPNRRAFESELRQRLSELTESGEPHTLLLIDLDKFQVVNDLCGFEGGDRLLQTVTDILLSYLSEGAYLARIGDDEFSLLLRGQDVERGYQTAESLRLAIDEYPFEWHGRMIPSSASVGLVQLESAEQGSGELMQAALAACNLAKQGGGGNCTRIYQAGDSVYQDHQQLVQSLPAIKEALAKGWMELYVQPIVPLQQSPESSLHHEILLRISDGQGELTSPQEFVRAAEHYDMMREVDRWVVEAFLALVEPYADKLPQTLTFSINLSGKSVDDVEFRRFLKERIQGTPLSSAHLGFEITETALVGDITDTAAFIQDIRKLGCTFSLDDFGSGYASFSYLKDFPVDFVKIDGVFVREILNKSADREMINTITQIAHFMDKRVIAEYVLDAEICRALQHTGVDYGQGDNFGKPRPLKTVLEEIVQGPARTLATASDTTER